MPDEHDHRRQAREPKSRPRKNESRKDHRQRGRTVDRARQLALETLREIRVRQQFANLVLPARLAAAHLSARDAALATALVYGSLRWQGFLDAVINDARQGSSRTGSTAGSGSASGSVLSRPRSRAAHIDPAVRDILRFGAYQLLFLDVPAYAAVSTSCDLARAKSGTRHAVGLVNALLRAVSRHGLDEWRAVLSALFDGASPCDDPSSTGLPVKKLSVLTSHPGWIVRLIAASRLHSPYGAVGEEQGVEQGDARDAEAAVRRTLEADNTTPPVTLCVRPGLADRDEVLAQVRAIDGAEAMPGRLSPYAIRLHGVDPSRIAAVKAGTVGVEDEGSQLAAIALASAPVAGEDPDSPVPAVASEPNESTHEWLDLCAGPGGKAALLAALAAGRGARLQANEPQEGRARLVEQNLRAFDSTAALAVTREDGRAYATDAMPGTAAAFDRVLVDAPCSGLGALRRRPEARWTKSPDDIAQLAGLQKQLLAAGLDSTRHGGVLAYVTCSPVLAETVGVVEAVLASRKDAQRLDTAAIMRTALAARSDPADRSDRSGTLGQAVPLPEHGDVQLFTDLQDTDMMYICLMRRR